MLKVKRHFLEIKLNEYKEKELNLPRSFEIVLDNKKDFNINKFFYKKVGADHYWRDRLVWSDKEWEKYVSNVNFETWVMKKNNKFVGFYEKEFHPSMKEVELINMGILKEYRGKKLGSLLLSHSIKKTFVIKPLRMWVHTCSLDHKYALQNYKSKGFKAFKEEVINFVA
ncbi:MAG: Acetyltransferase (GNAT) domain-containing protein [Pelagibacterales bacterium]|nr:Acetyltransferase (GNAT) domain-containing protein [Pelagibacterales bacterium]